MSLGKVPLDAHVAGRKARLSSSLFVSSHRKLLKRDEFSPRGVVRSEASRTALLESGVPPDCVVLADVTDVDAVRAAMEGCDACVICTSAK